MITKIIAYLKGLTLYHYLIVATVLVAIVVYWLVGGNMTTDQDSVYQEVTKSTLAGLSGEKYEEGEALVQVIVDDWLAQAEGLDIEEIVEIGKEDLEAKLQGQNPEERLVTLHNIVLEREVRQLSSQALRLAQQVVDGKKTFEDAKAEAKEINAEITKFLEEVKQVQDPSLNKRLRRSLADAGLECLYILNNGEGAMSIRLNRYAQ
jgi:hypothetical protein